MARKRNSFARIGILCLVMLAALGAMGATFSIWSETLYIDGAVTIGTTSGGLADGSCSPSSGETWISSQASGNLLEVTVHNAQTAIEYTCQFKVQNTGTIPIKITTIETDPTSASTITTIDFISDGTVINALTRVTDVLRVTPVSDVDLSFDVIFNVGPWDQ